MGLRGGVGAGGVGPKAGARRRLRKALGCLDQARRRANQLTEALLAREANASASSIIRFVQGGREVLAARTARTGWYVVSAVPE